MIIIIIVIIIIIIIMGSRVSVGEKYLLTCYCKLHSL